MGFVCLFVSVILKYSLPGENLGSGYSLVGLPELNELLLAKACCIQCPALSMC